jgi:hypothetical protein
MEKPTNFTAHILDSIAALSPEEQARALHELIAQPIKMLSLYRVLELRGAIAARFECTMPEVAAALTLIDGQIILREIAGDEYWR